MEDREKMTVIHIFIDKAADGSVVKEALPAVDMGDGTFQLLASPGIALDLAKGDLIKERAPDEPVSVIKRGGNLCVQVFSENLSSEDWKEIEDEFRTELPGSVDGSTSMNMTFSIPVTFGFKGIEDFFNKIANSYPLNWYYANVYDPDNGVTPLNWWEQTT